MITGKARNAYRQVEAEVKIHPVKLVYMLYERVLTHLELAEEGFAQKNARKRGENVSKAIAIVSELAASVKEGDQSEAAQFLRGIYTSILFELPKASTTGSVGTLKLARKYLTRLKDIWEETAMREAGVSPDVVSHSHEEEEHCSAHAPESQAKTGSYSYKAGAVEKKSVSGLSVAI